MGSHSSKVVEKEEAASDNSNTSQHKFNKRDSIKTRKGQKPQGRLHFNRQHSGWVPVGSWGGGSSRHWVLYWVEEPYPDGKKQWGVQVQSSRQHLNKKLPRGVHFYKFIVDGEWKYNPDENTTPDATGNINNCIDTTNAPAGGNVHIDAQLGEEGADINQYNEEEIVGHSIWSQNEVKTIAGARQKPRQITASISKVLGLQGLALDNEAPQLPLHYDSALFLNKKSQRLNALSENHSKLKDFAFLMKLLDNPLVPPAHCEV